MLTMPAKPPYPAAAVVVLSVLLSFTAFAKKPDGAGGGSGGGAPSPTTVTMTFRDCVVGVDCPLQLPDRWQSDTQGVYTGELNDLGMDLSASSKAGRSFWLDFTECADGPCDPPWAADHTGSARIRSDKPYVLDEQTGIYEPIEGVPDFDWRTLNVGEDVLLGVQLNFDREQKGKSPTWIFRFGRMLPIYNYCRQPEVTPLVIERLQDTQGGKRQWSMNVIDPLNADITCLRERVSDAVPLGRYHMRFSALVVEE